MALTDDQKTEAVQALKTVRDTAVGIAREKFAAHQFPVRRAVVCAVADTSSVVFLWLNDVNLAALTVAFDSLAKFVSKDLQEPSAQVLVEAVKKAKDDISEKDKNEESKNKILEWLDKLAEILGSKDPRNEDKR